MSNTFFKFNNSKDLAFIHVEVSNEGMLLDEVQEAFVDTFWDMYMIEEDAETASNEGRLITEEWGNCGEVTYYDEDDNKVVSIGFDIW